MTGLSRGPDTAVEITLRPPMRFALHVHEVAVGEFAPGELKGFVDVQDVAGDVVEPPLRSAPDIDADDHAGGLRLRSAPMACISAMRHSSSSVRAASRAPSMLPDG